MKQETFFGVRKDSEKHLYVRRCDNNEVLITKTVNGESITLSDAIVDIVETGSTLRENGLEVIEEVMPISARLIVNMACMKLRKTEIERIISGMESHLSL